MSAIDTYAKVCVSILYTFVQLFIDLYVKYIYTLEKGRDIMCTFHDRLRAIRLEKGLTQQQLADAIGVTKSTMAKYDRGDLEPNLTNVKKIADALNVSVDLLLGNDAFVKRMETADLAFLKSLRDTALKNNLINNVEYKTLSHSDVANKVFDIIDDDKTSDAVRLSLSVDIALAISAFYDATKADFEVQEKQDEK